MLGESSNTISFSSLSPVSSSSAIVSTQPATSNPISQSTRPISQSVPPSIPNTYPMLTRSKHGIFKPKAYAIMRDYSEVEPPNFNVASQHPQWIEAMDSEYTSLLKQHTWSLAPPLAGKNVVSCKWVYKIKRGSDRVIARYKVLLVAKGFLQQYGLDYKETFSPVVKPAILDVSNACLHGVLHEEVFLSQPPGYVDLAHPTYAYLLHKAIYGLKQSPRAWFESFTSQLFHIGFHASSADSILFILHHGSFVVYLLLYVDDMIITGNSPPFIDHLISRLSATFDLKDLGPLTFFLELQIEYTS
nr:retrovirus-related pol polyprotein from transposon tnt 1-94 [Quercus suber]